MKRIMQWVCVLLAILMLTATAYSSARAETAEHLRGTSVNVFTWGDYVDWAIPGFEEKYGITVNIDYYNSELEALNKLKAGRLGSVDVVNLGVGYEQWALETDIVEPFDIEKIPSVKEMYPYFQENTRDGDGPDYKVPFAWGTNSFMYNADIITHPVDDIEILWDPQYKGQICPIDRGELMWCYAAIALGRDINDTSDEAFDVIEPKLRDMLALSKTLWLTGDDINQYMHNDEVVLAVCDNGRAHRLNKEGKNIEYVIPKQGTEGWVDYMCLVKNAPNPEAGLLFINYMSCAETQAAMVDNVQYATPNSIVGEALDAETKTMLAMDDVNATLSYIQIPEYKGMEWVTRVQEMWTKLKAEAGI